MSRYSFEYTLFSSKEAPSVEEFSDLVIRMCMMGDDMPIGSNPHPGISSLVNILHSFRAAEAEYEDDNAEIPVVEDPENFFLKEVRRIVGDPKAFNPWDDEIWEEHWPTDCLWHPEELKRLALLTVGKREVEMAECRRLMEK
jgi:hypothetical protein